MESDFSDTHIPSETLIFGQRPTAWHYFAHLPLWETVPLYPMFNMLMNAKTMTNRLIPFSHRPLRTCHEKILITFVSNDHLYHYYLQKIILVSTLPHKNLLKWSHSGPHVVVLLIMKSFLKGFENVSFSYVINLWIQYIMN